MIKIKKTIVSLLNNLRFTHAGIWLGHEKRKKLYHRQFMSQAPKRSGSIERRIPREDGFAVFDGSDQSVISSAINCAKTHFSPEAVSAHYIRSGKKGPFFYMACEVGSSAHEPILNLAKSDIILQPIREYFGSKPVLLSASVWFSPNNHKLANFNSQLFHFDREDFRQIKCFIPIDDLTTDCGPLTILPASSSAALIKALWKRGKIPSTKGRYDDHMIDRLVTSPQIEVTGAIGTIMMVDTTQCLHFGSRTASKPKYHITLHYVTPFSPKLDSVRANLLEQSRKGEILLVAR